MTASPTPIPPTDPPTQPPATQPPVVPAEQFGRDLLAAFQTGDTTFMFLHLHPVVFDRYGEGQCRAHVDGFTADPSAMWTVISSTGPSPWDWVTDNRTTTVPDTWAVTVDEPSAGNRDLHFAEFDGEWKWFLDCGNPK
jgi:hypothetical protein